MPFTKCLGCNEQKRSKSDKFFPLQNDGNQLEAVNRLRTNENARKRKLPHVSEVPAEAKICKSCYNRLQVISVEGDGDPDPTAFRKGLSSHNRCTFGCRGANDMFQVPKKIRKDLLINYKFLAPENSQMCREHIGVSNYWPLVLKCQEASVEDHIVISQNMFKYFHEKRTKKAVFDIENIDSIDEACFKPWFAYDKEQFQKICSYSLHCSSVQIAIFLCKLRTALSHEQIAFLFGVCQATVTNAITAVNEDLTANMVPLFINTNNRSTLLEHKTPISSTLFDISADKACYIFDATYRFAQKSKNFSGQKQLWSEQKKMPLVKPMVGCTPDGYIAFVLGPYDAKHNDATILKDCFSRYDLSAIEDGDVVLVDRGFRDAMQFLRDKNLRVFSPGLGQLDTEEANVSRFVTKVRWVIEQVFGRLKMKFKLFAHPAHNSFLRNDLKALVIAFALLNMFHEPIYSDVGFENIGEIMKAKQFTTNKLKSVVEAYNLTQVRTPFIEMHFTSLDNAENNRLINFPSLSEKSLYEISLGDYQINNAVSYFAEHMNEGTFLVHRFSPPAKHATASLDYSAFGIPIDDPLLIRAYMKSRFRSGKHHYIFILVDKKLSDQNAINSYYCTCECGARTVGCCSHVMTIIWYLGWGQYNQIKTPNPSIAMSSVTIEKK